MDERDESFAELAVEKGLASREQAAECAQAVRKAAELGAVAKLPDTMVGKGYLTREQADGLLAELKRREAKVPALAGYELLSRIGSGGMGVVYKARQVAMDRIVALKILKPSLSRDRTFVARFVREARSAAKLNHPNIVQGIDTGRAEGYHYFVMEFVDGPTVAQRLRGEQVLGEKESLRIVRDVASALEHAEGHGIVHRDIKPDNVMLTSEGAAKLADLGLAKRAEAEAALTLEGSAMGTPYYMSPEQARGERDLDTRSDIYSLGATLFHMVTGSPPFGGETPAVIVAKRLSEPTPSPRERRPTVSPATSRLIQRMMAREQRQRFQTAAELIEGIERAQRGELPAARPAAGRRPAARRRPVPRARRASPTPWILAGVGAVAALVVVAVLASRPQPGGEPEDEAVLRAATRTAVPKGRRPDPAAQLAIEAAALRARMAPLLAGGRFGEALALVGGFATKHPSPQGADAAATLRREVRTRAEARYGALVAEADEAARGKDYAKARAAMAPARAFGLPDFADRARRKLAEIDEREKHAALWAKWDAIREKSQKLADAGKWDEAVAALAPAKALALRRIGQLIAQQTRAVGRTRRKAIDAAASAYAKESDRAWALFGQRQYAEAQRLLDKLAADKAHRLAADRVAADGEAAKCLRRFWARVEDGVRALEGRQLAIDGPVGTVKRVKDGVVTIESGGVEVDRRVDQMTTEQAVGIAGLGRDAGERLLLGVFLLAEGRKLDEATKALAAAGKSRAVAIFRERLAAVKREPKGHGFTTQWTRLFDGRTLDGWRVIRSFPKVAKAGRVGVGMGVIGLWEDGGRTGIAWDGGFPTDGYEVLIEAQWVRAGGRFCHVVFPVGEAHGVLAVCDGHVGLGNVDGRRASDNATTTRGKFRKGQWYTIRLRVGSSRVQASIDGERVVDFATGGARLSLRPGLWPARPFGLVSERSRAAFRHVQVRMLSGKGATPKR